LDQPEDYRPIEHSNPIEITVGPEIEAEFTVQYLGGHPGFPKKGDVHLTLNPNNMVIDEMELSIPYKSIKQLENMAKDKITAARLFFSESQAHYGKKNSSIL
jgi:hypothetical protein